MFRVNFRMNDGVEKKQILQFFEDIGYEHIVSDNIIAVYGIGSYFDDSHKLSEFLLK